MVDTGALREARTLLAEDRGIGGVDFGAALSDVLDEFLGALSSQVELAGRWALVGLGSYARRELCPGSDVDVTLLHEGAGPVDDAASGLWYPLWDAGFVLGHSTRTIKEALRVADADLDALTALLDVREVAGDSSLCTALSGQAHRLAQRRRRRVLGALAERSEGRRDRPGPIAEMLEPNLKDGAGGLRDVQALDWAGRVLGDGQIEGARPHDAGLAGLVERGFLQPGDPRLLADAKATLLEARVALHRTTGTRSDLLTLQEQDAVAARLGVSDADALVRDVAEAGRAIAWVADEAWARLRSAERGPLGRVARRDRALVDGAVLRDDRVALTADADVDTTLALRTAQAAAERGTAIDRGSLERLRDAPAPAWGPDERAAFLSLLAAGRGAVPVLESLDHVGLLVKLLPEWERVRSLPQRNAYHRHTVDRHLLEAVAETALLLRDEGPDGDVARRAPRDVLLLGALLHDIGKGGPGDHSVHGADTAVVVGRRLGVPDDDLQTLAWLVRHHLLLVETATRRDLSENATVTRFGRSVGASERLDLLYTLTVADSRATGPAAWNPVKAKLVRELFLKTDALLERGVVVSPLAAQCRAELSALIGPGAAEEFLDSMPAAYTTAFDATVLVHHRELLEAGRVAVEWSDGGDGQLECTVVAPDRTGLLATVAGVLSLSGFDIRDATAYSHLGGMAVEVFSGVDRFGRLADDDGRREMQRLLDEALGGELPLAQRLRDRARRYEPAPSAAAPDVSVIIDPAASGVATVVEVHGPDRVGLLAQIAAVFAELDADVSLAKVATLGDRVVDVFYVRDAHGAKITDPKVLERLETTLLARLASEARDT